MDHIIITNYEILSHAQTNKKNKLNDIIYCNNIYTLTGKIHKKRENVFKKKEAKKVRLEERKRKKNTPIQLFR